MLQAQNGRQFNLAAKAIRTFLAEKGIELKHNEALTLTSRLTGHANYEAAQASLDGPAKGVSPDANTWRQLAHAIGTLSDEQLDMPVYLTEGCDSDGNSSFWQSGSLVKASTDCISAGQLLFAANQPALLCTEYCPWLDSDDARRIEFQFEVGSGESSGLATHEIRRHGLAGAIAVLNADYACHIDIGKYLAFSADENGYWNADFGFVGDRDSATGFETEDEVLNLYISSTTKVTPILYTDAVDINPND